MKPRDELWWAYVDRELTPAEASHVDEMISSEDRVRAAGDLAMEAELAEVLGAPVECPKHAWKAAVAAVKHEQRAVRRRARWTRWSLAACIPAAAMALILLLAFFPKQQPQQPSFLSLKGLDVSSVAAKSQVTDGVSGVRDFMARLELPVALDPADALDGQDRPYRLIGARNDTFNGERVVQLLFDCEGQPASIVIAQKAGNAAREIGKALASGTVRASRAFGDVVVAVVGADAPRDLIRVVDDHWPDPQEAMTPVSEPNVPEAPMQENASPAPEDPLGAPPAEAIVDTPPVEKPIAPPDLQVNPELLREAVATLV